MINVLIPMAGSGKIEGADFNYPKALIEIDGTPLIEHVIKSLESIPDEKHLVFILNEEDCTRYYLDNIIKLVVTSSHTILKVSSKTKGAACSALMGIEQINNSDELIIANSDSLISTDFTEVINYFRDSKADGGSICFDSIHPKWSYMRISDDDFVMEAAEKRPISRWANAGFYYFKEGSNFVKGSMKMIEKGASTDGRFFIAPVFNEMILMNKKMKVRKISKDKYVNFYSVQKVNEYADTLRHQGEN